MIAMTARFIIIIRLKKLHACSFFPSPSNLPIRAFPPISKTKVTAMQMFKTGNTMLIAESPRLPT